MTTLTPWHTSPEAIALLAQIDRKPTRLVDRDRWGDWVGQYAPTRKTDALTRFWFDACVSNTPTHSNPPFTTPHHVIAAVFGDPMGHTFNTHWDTSPEYAALRGELCGAATRYGHLKLARRITRRQLKIDRKD